MSRNYDLHTHLLDHDESALQEAHERMGALIAVLVAGDDHIRAECEATRELIGNVLASAEPFDGDEL